MPSFQSSGISISNKEWNFQYFFGHRLGIVWAVAHVSIQAQIPADHLDPFVYSSPLAKVKTFFHPSFYRDSYCIFNRFPPGAAECPPPSTNKLHEKNGMSDLVSVFGERGCRIILRSLSYFSCEPKWLWNEKGGFFFCWLSYIPNHPAVRTPVLLRRVLVLEFRSFDPSISP